MLGPLEVRAGSGELLEIGGARLRTLLIMLALRPGRLVPASQLIDGLWADQAPSGPPNALQAHAAGRGSAALEVYEQTRKRLADQLGADPSAELSAPHLELLREPPEPARPVVPWSGGCWSSCSCSSPAGWGGFPPSLPILGPLPCFVWWGSPLPRSSTLGEKYTNGRCGVPRAVRSEQAEHGAGPDREVDAVQRPGLAELLDQPSAMIEYVMPSRLRGRPDRSPISR